MNRVLHQLHTRAVTFTIAGFLALFCNATIAEVKNEYKVKAAIVYKLLRYISWPEELLASNKINLCINQGDPYFNAFSDVDGRVVHKRKIILKVRPEHAKVNECHIIFASAEGGLNGLALKENAKKGVLTISDASRFAERGGMINLIVENNRVRFRINPQAAYQSELRINSSLLRLADIVETDDTDNTSEISLHVDSEAFE